ncbi:M13 family metallopeptidase [Xanthomonas hortorum pv. vitians]|uniref:M13 family metallopeptidase n=1 Tax=Xanthomonas hortorum TaxID=56454 RepID=UPI001459E986|nr:M13 family metallopeptidase [Xanthomonas hortorum]MCE4290713.1 M13 family metallopeptidase [Xanthomonas hortorum pv. vitians]MCE4294882.1 M13 family metallopeptidase [Xanthomonas hortorum pv. vitians]MDT7853461.1 M13 family metallopeptidase [Xanthomonas hortorum pv. vitians]NMI27654.1 M13 family metallopeptidase [Xanthomonas hortorum pv. vitians]
MMLAKTSVVAFALLAALPGCKRSSDESRSSQTPVTGTESQKVPAESKPTFDVGELGAPAEACKNFYGFVNGQWEKANPIPPDRSNWGTVPALMEQSLTTQREIVEQAAKQASDRADPVARKLGLLYASGMDEAAIEAAGTQPIRPQLAAIAALSSAEDVASYIMQRHAEGDAQVFKFSAQSDLHDASLQIAFADEGGLALPSKDYYSAPDYAAVRTAYLAYIAKSLELAGSSADEAKTQAKDVLALETRLASASLAPVDQRNPKNMYHFVSVAEADKATPHFSWTRFLATQDVEVGKGFSLSQPRFFAAFDRELATAPIAQWRAYLSFHAIDAASMQLSKAFVDNNFAFYGKALSGQPQQQPRWKSVLSVVNDSMGEGLGQLYVAKVFTPEAKQRAADLVDNIRAALKVRIEHLEWMTGPTKAKALEKWESMLPRIGYPDTWRDWSGLEITPGAYYQNVQAAAKFNYRYNIMQVGKPTDRTRWVTTPQTVNAFYSPGDNSINFPAAVLQPPFFDPNADDALNYGSVGSLMGHEATHGFDDQGSQFDAAGNGTNWWAPADRAAFEQRAEGLVKQFDGYVPLPNHPKLHVNGKLTLGENIADLGGLNVGYDALQANLRKHPERAVKVDGYTQDQRFFLAFARNWRWLTREERQLVQLAADPHAPAKVRAFAAPSNMPQFAAAFSCKAGDPMVRDEKERVVIW